MGCLEDANATKSQVPMSGHLLVFKARFSSIKLDCCAAIQTTSFISYDLEIMHMLSVDLWSNRTFTNVILPVICGFENLADASYIKE